jgi:hypothetical protein
MRMQYFIFLSGLILFSFLYGTEPIQLKGCVMGEEGTPVTGASIMVKGSKAGTVTDSAGRFFMDRFKIAGYPAGVCHRL